MKGRGREGKDESEEGWAWTWNYEGRISRYESLTSGVFDSAFDPQNKASQFRYLLERECSQSSLVSYPSSVVSWGDWQSSIWRLGMG